MAEEKEANERAEDGRDEECHDRQVRVASEEGQRSQGTGDDQPDDSDDDVAEERMHRAILAAVPEPAVGGTPVATYRGYATCFRLLGGRPEPDEA